jgi:hypothetical protein
MTQTVGRTIIGPADHGRRMSLDEFDTAVGLEGRLYELSRRVIVVLTSRIRRTGTSSTPPG